MGVKAEGIGVGVWGGHEVEEWVRGSGARGECGGGQARTERFRGLADREGKVPKQKRRELGGVFVGWRLQISGSEPDKKNDFEFFWGRERERGVPGRGRQRRELGPGCEVRGSGGGSGGGQGRGDRGKGVEGGVEECVQGSGARGECRACRGQGRGRRVRWGGRQDYLPCKGLPRRSTPKAGSADFFGSAAVLQLGAFQRSLTISHDHEHDDDDCELMPKAMSFLVLLFAGHCCQ